jgi:hypothetical protein
VLFLIPLYLSRHGGQWNDLRIYHLLPGTGEIFPKLNRGRSLDYLQYFLQCFGEILNDMAGEDVICNLVNCTASILALYSPGGNPIKLKKPSDSFSKREISTESRL